MHRPWGPSTGRVWGLTDSAATPVLAACGYAGEFPYHWCSFVRGFVRMLLPRGEWVGMCPRYKTREELQSGLFAR